MGDILNPPHSLGCLTMRSARTKEKTRSFGFDQNAVSFIWQANGATVRVSQTPCAFSYIRRIEVVAVQTNLFEFTFRHCATSSRSLSPLNITRLPIPKLELR